MRSGTALALAWRSLTHDRRRFVAAVAGIAFAVLLMIVELGFLFAVYDSSTLWIDAFDADLIMVSRHKDDMNPPNPFPRERLSQSLAIPGVTSAHPIYFERIGKWSSSGLAQRNLIRVVAFDPATQVFKDPELATKGRLLTRLDTALVDRKLRDSYGGLFAGVEGELQDRKLRVIDDFAVGPDLQLNATLVTSHLTFRRCFRATGGRGTDSPSRGAAGASDPLDRVEFGLLKVAAGHSPKNVAQALSARLLDDVVILTPAALKAEIHGFWTRNQPVGGVFGIGLTVGFVIGLIVCYQVLFTDVVDQLPQFSTLKAMGYPGSFLIRLAWHQGLIMAVCALGVGLPIGGLAFWALEDLTGLVFRMTTFRMACVAVATVLMCGVAGRLAIRKALAADPAEVFYHDRAFSQPAHRRAGRVGRIR